MIFRNKLECLERINDPGNGMVVTVTAVPYRAVKEANLLGSNILCAVPMTFIL